MNSEISETVEAASAGEVAARVSAPPRVAPRAWEVAGLLALIAGACLLPFELSGFRLFQFTQVFVYAIALLGLNILTGYNGQISLGHGAFYGIGAYTAAIMIDRWGVPYGWTVPVAATLSLPIIWFHGFALLVAAIPLWREDRARARREPAGSQTPSAAPTMAQT